MLRQAQHVNTFARFDMAVGIGHDVEFAATRANFLQIRLELFEQLVVGRDGDDRHAAVDERQGTMLEFACGIRLGVDVGNLLQLERAFERRSG